MKGPMPGCPVHEECLEWVHKYLKDCVCSFRDEVSLVLGLISVFSWGVAEVPQILTNFKEKSTEGVSLAFLMTWVVGDVFNLAGCYLEPATLPTQFYMAALYTLTTVILVLQTIFYDYIYIRYQPGEAAYEPIEAIKTETPKVHVQGQKRAPTISTPLLSPSSSPPTSVINVPSSRRGSSKDLYYTSARSLASSHTPMRGSYLVGSRDRDSGGHPSSFLRSSEAGHESTSSPQQESHNGRLSQEPHSQESPAGSLLRTAAASVLLVGSVGLSSSILGGSRTSSSGYVGRHHFLQTGRRMLQMSGSGSFLPMPRRPFLGEIDAEGPWGEIFGWCMAAIYMGGRFPQIWLNIKRGTVEGLNPLMFFFALVGNATYVGSIIVRSTAWTQIKPNMPWLVDAAVCVCLDLFILCQFVYYTRKALQEEQEEEKALK